MQAQVFIQKLNTDIPKVVLLSGEESFFVDKIVKMITDIFLKDEIEQQSVVLPTESTVAQMKDYLSTSGFFSNKTLLIVKKSRFFGEDKSLSEKDKKDYLQLLSSLQEDSCLILICPKPDKRVRLYKEFDKIGTIVECDKLKASQVQSYLQNLAKSYGCSFDKAAIELIMQYVYLLDNISLYFLHSEVEKISLYAGENKIWTKEHIENIFSDLSGTSAFMLSDSLAKGDAKKALFILNEQILQGEYILKIVGLLAYQLRKWLLVKKLIKQNLSRSELASRASLMPFVLDKTIEQSKNLSEDKIENALLSLSDLSRQIHIGANSLIHLEKIIIKFCS